nr:hypothetical protein Iba_chr07cCG3960 [Ipomoea batatas]
MMEKIRVLQRSRKMIGNADGPFEVTVMGGFFVAGQRKKSTKPRREIMDTGSAVWGIWRWRKDIAFTGKETTLLGKIEQITEHSKEINIVFANLQHGRNAANNHDAILSWQPP